MDKNEYNLKLQEIDKYVDQENYAQAAAVADQIDWKRVRNVRTLCLVSEIYEAQNRYEDSKALLLRAYKRSPVGRAILYRLVEVTIKLKQFDEAIEYYSEYVQAAPHDNSRYILKYKIYRGRGSSVDEQIDILKEYLSQEYNEKYAYELAKLYLEADRIQECLATCDDLVLWFHSGKYVIKALELKKKYAPLTPKQQEIYDHRFDQEELEEEAEEDQIGQEKQIVDTSSETLAETIVADTTKEIAEDVSKAAGELTQQEAQSPARETASDATRVIEPKASAADMSAEGETALSEEPERDVSDTLDDQINLDDNRELRSEVVKSMREIVSGVGMKEVVDEDQEAADQVIEESKRDQEQAAQKRSGLQPVRPLTMPQLQKKQSAGRVSIDDVLLSMGDRGAAVRDAVKETPSPASDQKGGVVSAVDEALLNMGVMPEKKEPAGDGQIHVLPEADRKAAQEALHDTHEFPGKEALYGDRQTRPLPDREELHSAIKQVDEQLSSETRTMPDLFSEARNTVDGEALEAKEDIADMTLEAEEETDTADASVEEAAEAEVSEMEKTETTQEPAGGEAAPEEAAAADQLPEDNDAEAETAEVVSGQTQTAKQEEPEVQAVPVADSGEEEKNSDEPLMSMDQVMGARTRVMPTQKISGAYEEARENQEETQEQTAPKPRMWVRPQLRGFFEGFLEVPNMDRQIAFAIDHALAKGQDRTSRTGNILIFGGHGCGKTTIATGIAKAVAQARGSASVKLAKIYATDLNRKDIPATIAKIAGGVLIIEEAGDLDDSVADQLTTAMEFRTDGLIVILEDEQRYMHDKLMRHPRLTMKFTSQIYIPVFTMDELVRFGQLYAGDRGHTISPEGEAVLREHLSARDKKGEPQSITAVLEEVDHAIHRSDKFFRRTFSGKKRFDENGRVILLEKDFQ